MKKKCAQKNLHLRLAFLPMLFCCTIQLAYTLPIKQALLELDIMVLALVDLRQKTMSIQRA